MKEYIYYIEILAAVVGTLTYNSYKHTHCRYFLFYLWFVVLVESYGQIPGLYKNPDYHNAIFFLNKFIDEKLLFRNIWLMNIYDLVTYNFYLFFFLNVIDDKRTKRWIIFFVLVLWVAFILNLADNEMDLNFGYLNYVMLVGASSVFICSILYFLQVISEDKIFDIHKRLTFWLIVGMLFFQLACTPIFLFSKQLNFSDPVYNVILSISNYILYGSFIIGFMINAHEQKKIQKQPAQR
ncbi:hypothetical protein MQE36_14380 [Zhouia spongiae]|uniref:Uncharacterized protein n=1 Tax=Zhouia spongiae TaxID=2202721 RepID=A0ABY3YK96_9FLAO|nr:hypothetical protein [Zhouia spongiae]UNY98265.1 hypothetical protein MQE36_14380 [Zhouia spongiae]